MSSFSVPYLRGQRRGLLENNLIIERFLSRHAHQLNDEDIQALNALLALDDLDLLDLFLGRCTLPSDTSPVMLKLLESIQKL